MRDWKETEPESCDSMQLAVSSALRVFVQREKTEGGKHCRKMEGFDRMVSIHQLLGRGPGYLLLHHSSASVTAESLILRVIQQKQKQKDTHGTPVAWQKG